LFELIISNRARKSLRHIPKHYVERIVIALEVLKQNPAPVPEYDAKKSCAD
jgi:mRNA-degrading endonuclease RelE of RelBE toxin-antitoxin system